MHFGIVNIYQNNKYMCIYKTSLINEFFFHKCLLMSILTNKGSTHGQNPKQVSLKNEK